jgi:acyl carrier protein
MTNPTRDEIKADLVRIIQEIRDDWDYSGEIEESTGLFRDLGLESIDAVALGAALEEYFDRALPFAEFLTKAREENWPDITVGCLLEFMTANLSSVLEGQAP